MSLCGLILFVFQPVASLAGAQRLSETTVWMEAGALQIEQAQRTSVVSSEVSAAVRRATTQFALSASGAIVQSNDSSGAMQGTAGAEFLIPGAPQFRIEASVSGTQFGAFSSEHGKSRTGFLRPQFVRGWYGAFAAIGAGSTERSNEKFHSLAWDVGVWTRRGRWSGMFTLRHSFTNDYPLIEASEFLLVDSAYHYSLRDVEATVSARVHSRIELQATGVLRRGFEQTRGHGRALSFAALLQLSHRISLSMTGGRQAADLLSGMPSARLLGGSLRVNFVGPPIAARAVPQAQSTSPFATQVTRHANGGASVRVRVEAPPNARVELSGSFNDWSVITVSHSGTYFEHTFELPSGTHRIAIRIDGRDWKAPTGLVRTRDDFGGEAGIIIVP